MANIQNVVCTTGSPQITTVQQPPTNNAPKYANLYRKFGITEISLGFLSMILAILNIAFVARPQYYYYDTANIGAGIWCGSLVIVAGFLGYRSGIKPDQCLIISTMVVTIFAALGSGTMVTIEAIGCASHNASYEPDTTTFVIHIILTIIGSILFVVNIVHSSFCCAGSCSCCKSESTHSQTTALPVPAQVVYIPAGQQQHYAAPARYVIQGQPNRAFVSHQQPPSSGLVYPASQVQLPQVNTHPPQ